MTAQLRFYEKEKRKIEDFCNICGQYTKLTYDHIPPKCCFNDMKATQLEIMLGAENVKKESYTQNCFYSQNGIKIRSICLQCNNSLLAKYDKALEAFMQKIKATPANEENCTQKVFPIRVNAIAKSICGHFLAMKRSYDEQNIIDQELRDYVQNPLSLPPRGKSLLIRYYPFSTVFLMRDAVLVNVGQKEDVPEGPISVLSSFPVSYILCNNTVDCGMLDLFKYCSIDDAEEVNIDFDFRTAFFYGTEVLRHQKWPCNIADDEYGTSCLLCSQEDAEEAIYARRDKTVIEEKIFHQGKKSD